MKIIEPLRSIGMVLAVAFLASCAGLPSGTKNITLDGAKQVPPVSTAASGSASVTVGDDMSISGKVTTTGLTATVAHIHQGAAGVNGPVVIPLTKNGANEWLVPPGAKLTEAQYKTYKDGALYINVHTAANKGGEIRGQLTP